MHFEKWFYFSTFIIIFALYNFRLKYKKMAKIVGTIIVDEDKCKGCGVCVSICPTKVIELGKNVNAKGYNYAVMQDGIECIGCASCGMICPDSCITVYKEKIEK